MKDLEKYFGFAVSVAGGVLLAGYALYTFRANAIAQQITKGFAG